MVALRVQDAAERRREAIEAGWPECATAQGARGTGELVGREGGEGCCTGIVNLGR